MYTVGLHEAKVNELINVYSRCQAYNFLICVCQFVKFFFVKFIICKNFHPGKFLAVMCIIIKVITILVALKIQVPPIFDITPQILPKCKLSIEECGQ